MWCSFIHGKNIIGFLHFLIYTLSLGTSTSARCSRLLILIVLFSLFNNHFSLFSDIVLISDTTKSYYTCRKQSRLLSYACTLRIYWLYLCFSPFLDFASTNQYALLRWQRWRVSGRVEFCITTSHARALPHSSSLTRTLSLSLSLHLILHDIYMRTSRFLTLFSLLNNSLETWPYLIVTFLLPYYICFTSCCSCNVL